MSVIEMRDALNAEIENHSGYYLIDGNELVRLVIRFELYIKPVQTYVLEEFYDSEE